MKTIQDNILELADRLNKDECVTVNYDDKYMAVLEYATFENNLTELGIDTEWNQIPFEVKEQIAKSIHSHFNTIPVRITCATDDYYIDFDYYIEIGSEECNYDSIVKQIHKFHDLARKYIEIYVTEYLTK